MLYVTTRSNIDAYTVHRSLTENRGPDGGLYLPFRHPRFAGEELDAMLKQSSSHCIAQVLNRLFNTKLTAWDVDFAIGRSPVRLEAMGHRILLANCWYTAGFRFSDIVEKLSLRICPESAEPSNWTQIAVRSAVLFGLFSELRRFGITQADISCLSGDFLTPISAWYARRWGLPIGQIICCCNENNGLWELLCHGQMRTDGVSIPTSLPAADVSVPTDLERLIFECGGLSETQRYLEAVRKGRAYLPGDGVLSRLRFGMDACVISSRRLETVIPSVYRTHGKILSPATALAYSGLLDHRAKTVPLTTAWYGPRKALPLILYN